MAARRHPGEGEAVAATTRGRAEALARRHPAEGEAVAAMARGLPNQCAASYPLDRASEDVPNLLFMRLEPTMSTRSIFLRN
jgi:hypothetical protein